MAERKPISDRGEDKGPLPDDEVESDESSCSPPAFPTHPAYPPRDSAIRGAGYVERTSNPSLTRRCEEDSTRRQSYLTSELPMKGIMAPPKTAAANTPSTSYRAPGHKGKTKPLKFKTFKEWNELTKPEENTPYRPPQSPGIVRRESFRDDVHRQISDYLREEEERGAQYAQQSRQRREEIAHEVTDGNVPHTDRPAEPTPLEREAKERSKRKRREREQRETTTSSTVPSTSTQEMGLLASSPPDDPPRKLAGPKSVGPQSVVRFGRRANAPEEQPTTTSQRPASPPGHCEMLVQGLVMDKTNIPGQKKAPVSRKATARPLWLPPEGLSEKYIEGNDQKEDSRLLSSKIAMSLVPGATVPAVKNNIGRVKPTHVTISEEDAADMLSALCVRRGHSPEPDTPSPSSTYMARQMNARIQEKKKEEETAGYQRDMGEEEEDNITDTQQMKKARKAVDTPHPSCGRRYPRIPTAALQKGLREESKQLEKVRCRRKPQVAWKDVSDSDEDSDAERDDNIHDELSYFDTPGLSGKGTWRW